MSCECYLVGLLYRVRALELLQNCFLVYKLLGARFASVGFFLFCFFILVARM